MADRWYEPLRASAASACASAPPGCSIDIVLFYLARWCQKKARDDEPDVGAFENSELTAVAARIAVNLDADGGTVERLMAADGDHEAWTALRRVLLTSARRREPALAGDHADEALQRIAEVLLTGTPPTLAAARLTEGPAGSRNEYVFQSPFELWARRIVINLIVDDQRHRGRDRAGAPGSTPAPGPSLDRATLLRARAALPGLLAAVRALPPKQRAVMVLSLHRSDLDDVVREHLGLLAPDLFSEAGPAPASDDDIATQLGASRHLVAANRSAARRKLVREDPLWGLLLDALLPHRTTRPLADAATGDQEPG